MQRLDIVLFGATGFTGTFVARELAKKSLIEKFKWGIAGRSIEKLKDLLSELKRELNYETNDVEAIIVDVNDSNSVLKMCFRAKILINCVGPYRFYGESVIKECIKAKTHHIDVSGEPEFLERMQLKYDREALEAGIYIIGSCGFDSIPADLGFLYTKQMFDGDLNHIESYLTLESNGADVRFNYATWESAVYGIGSATQLGPIRKQLFATKLPKNNFKPLKKLNSLGYFYNNYLKKYAMAFFGADKSVVQRTQYLEYEVLNERPIIYNCYFTINEFKYVRSFIIWGLLFTFLAKYKFGRSLLLKYYKFFSRGLATKREFSDDQMKKSAFRMTFFGEGWKTKLTNVNEQHNEAPDSSIIVEVSGPEPGYITTSFIITNCALVLLNEGHRLPSKGGVLPPGFAFQKTTLRERLERDGMKFNIITNNSTTNSNL